MKVYVGADHRGFYLKQKIYKWLLENNYQVLDMGAYQLDLADDYTLYAEKVAIVVADNPKDRGILICGSGVGVDVTANKFDGVRASIGINPEQVKAGRNDDDMNILVLAADFISEKDAKEMTRTFLETGFSGKEKHKRRLDDIKKIEENN
ncbi:MAG: RpiB/LacA/LacB family sugar-phosphate isomerase [Patescibacteria group bacterium]|nr:RpiB/LacA/LacB family sugar-phosphate isomerase [Patescibacteria group bacterium]MCX7928452.1 RpiB/LacA/LacB family sugar-phosphate isomerase [Patescibacteria group bacterium]